MPVVVGIGGDRELPSAQAIYAGEFANFLIVFDPADYVSAISDYSCKVAGVSLSLVPESENLLRVELSSELPAGTVADIKFRGQTILKVSAVQSAEVLEVMGRSNLPFLWALTDPEGDIIPEIKFDHAVSNNEIVAGFTCDLEGFSPYLQGPVSGQENTYLVGFDVPWQSFAILSAYPVYFKGQHIMTIVTGDF